MQWIKKQHQISYESDHEIFKMSMKRPLDMNKIKKNQSKKESNATGKSKHCNTTVSGYVLDEKPTKKFSGKKWIKKGKAFTVKTKFLN